MQTVEPIKDPRKLDAMKKYLRGKNMRDYALFVVGINTGLRNKDLKALKIYDISSNGRAADRVYIREKKTGKEKIFRLNETAQKAIKEYLATRQATADELLFPSREGGEISSQQIRNIILDAARAVGVTDAIGTTTLRKTFGYHARRKGVPIEVLMQIFNHSWPGVTQRYIGISQDEMEEVYMELNI